MSIVTASVGAFKILLPYLKPYIILLGAFGYFVLWNGGVVLGEQGRSTCIVVPEAKDD